MNLKPIIKYITILVFVLATSYRVTAHDIYFCGEKIPVTPRVAEKLMDIIKKQISYNVVGRLKGKESQYIRTIELILEKIGLPDDFKYLAIVESGLRNVESPVGAAGFWQIMPGTAKDLNLLVNGEVDERNDLNASTIAACKLLAQYFKEIRKNHGVSSWVLTAAAYNYGSGNMKKIIRNQGKNYFEMDLNKETAEYVYKIIAVKELFEYPELYLKDFGYNVFNSKSRSKIKNEKESDNIDKSDFIATGLKVNTSDGNYSEKLTPKNNKNKKTVAPLKNNNAKYIFANITGKYNNFKDGDQIKLTLQSDLKIENSLKNAGNTITGTGWKIDDKIFIDFGYGKKLIIIDFTNKKHDGIAETTLKDKYEICLQLTEFIN